MGVSSSAPLLRAARSRAGAYLGFQLVSLALFGRGVLRDFTGSVVGSYGGDQGVFIWSLAWWPHAIANGLDPLATDRVFAPDGWNLAWTSVICGPALVLTPITETLGPIVSFNLLALAAPALAAFAAYLLARELVDSWVGAITAGLLFGFGSYLTSQTINHLNLALVFPIPLAVLLVVRHVRGTIGDRRFVGLLALCLIAQLLTFLETALTLALFGTLALGLAALVADAPTRARLRRTTVRLVIAASVALAVTSPYLLAALARGNPIEAGVRGSGYPTDAANLLTPTLAHTFNPLGLDASRLATNATEQSGYLGPVLLLVVALAVAMLWRRRTTRLLLAFSAVVLACALGTRLTWYGSPLVGLPWGLVDDLPLLRHAFPARFPVYLWLALALLAAQVMAVLPRPLLIAVAVGLVLTLLPTTRGSVWATRLATPAFFDHGRWRSVIAPSDNVLIVPFSYLGNSMLWQERSGFGFRQAGGYVSATIPHVIAGYLLTPALYGGPLPAHPELELRRFLCGRRVTAAIAPVDLGGPLIGLFDETLGDGEAHDGVRVWKVPACIA